MKIKEGYILRRVAGQNIVIPSDEKSASFRGALVLNDTGAFIWSLLEKDNTREGLEKALTEKYEVSTEKASESIVKMLATFEKYGVLDA